MSELDQMCAFEVVYMPVETNDVVRLLEDIPSEEICRGSTGVVVALFSEPEEAYEVEFCDEHGASTVQVALRPSQFEIVM
ncbi:MULTISPECIES: DUF4926 domain-containing protein [Stenotrophomonas maltophilia group]|nr:DUF4926 domain-containing protein [Stenotrophomonas maltophilia]MDQ4682545.1 DUF4926 domain-containing protein [Stenotrophomonas maltophilia group sp. RNC7]UGB21526.1 DUF4926 domain-containing protein [Stenotrophomonas maltophilia]